MRYHEVIPDTFELPVGKYRVLGDRGATSVRLIENTREGEKLLFEGDIDTLQQLGLALVSVTTCVRRS